MRLVLRHIDAERAHRIGMAVLRVALAPAPVRALVQRRCRPDPACATEALGISLASPLGVAAGLDKNARTVLALAAIGFGFVEVGTVTAQPQPGNPRPRLHRLIDDRAIVNRMGFNNDGAEVIAARLAALRRTAAGRRAVIGVNIGRSKSAGVHDTVADYCTSARLLAPHADYLTINISSPNTPGLRDLHAVEQLRPLLVEVRRTCADARAGRGRLPVLLKVSPDSSDADIAAVAALAQDVGVDGLITTNTTVGRTGLVSRADTIAAAGGGGLSGPPLRARSEQVQQLVRDSAGARLVIVASGGVDSPADAADRLAAGAALVQGYTGFVYGGALWARRVNRRIAQQRALARTQTG